MAWLGLGRAASWINIADDVGATILSAFWTDASRVGPPITIVAVIAYWSKIVAIITASSGVVVTISWCISETHV